MTHDAIIRANERRAEIQAHAGAMGIDEAYVSRVVDTFYDRVRADARLGPIFDAVIGDRWSEHLPRMKRFTRAASISRSACAQCSTSAPDCCPCSSQI